MWKLGLIAGENVLGILFQKDLIVWKPRLKSGESLRDIFVSEGLNSVETALQRLPCALL